MLLLVFDVVLSQQAVCASHPDSEAMRVRPVTVTDAIEMTHFENLNGAEAALFSPDKEKFLILTRKGDVEKNTNRYSLLLFRVSDGPRSVADTLVSFSSASNRPAITLVKWLDQRRIAFLGENQGETQQLYIIDSETRKLERITDHRTNLISFAIGPDGDSFFMAEGDERSLLDDKSKRRGVIVSHQALPDLITLRQRLHSREYPLLFMKRAGNAGEMLVQARGISSLSALSLWLSPNGRYLILKRMVLSSPPAYWEGYSDHWIKAELRENRFDRVLLSLYQFEIIDTANGQSQILLDAPTGFAPSEIAWAPDSHSIVITGTYLPLDLADESERKARESKRFVIEMTIPDKTLTVITDQNLRLQRWDYETNTLVFTNGDKSRTSVGAMIAYRKADHKWTRVDADQLNFTHNGASDVTVKEGINTPPLLVRLDRESKQTRVLLDPNPQFKALKFGNVESIHFSAAKGQACKATLYLPVDYQLGNKYPLVIQTHALNLERFAIDGPFSTAFAAQPLAGVGFVVAQLQENTSRTETPSEVPDEASSYEGVIDYLDKRGLIERDRVGIIGFSRTGLAVEYFLTHSSYRIAAASLADISDAGYFRYLALLNMDPGFARDSEIVNGGIPFGETLSSWLRNSPGFNLDKVMAPVLLAAQDPMSLFFEWEWFAGLSRLGRPVELVYLPEGGHVLVKPSDRMISQQGNVDWFRFWLKNEEDTDPSKAEQYRRWGDLRRQLQQLPINH